VVFFIFEIVSAKANDTDRWLKLFDSSYYGRYSNVKPLRQVWMDYSSNSDPNGFNFCAEGIDALIAVYQASGNQKYFDDAVTMCQNIAGSATNTNAISNSIYRSKGNFKGWVSKSQSGDKKTLYNQEVPLYESYIFRYFAKLLYVIKTTPALSSKCKNEYNTLLDFVETSGWGKWYSRGGNSSLKNSYLMRARTHMSAHWGLVALYLSETTNDNTIRQQCLSFLNVLNGRLRKNFRVHPTDTKSYIWNATWDDSRGTTIVQDVSHGNHVVSYIVESYALGKYWKRDDIDKLCNLVKDVLYDDANNSFYDTLDRSALNGTTTKGSYQSDGWVKLAKYDSSVYNLYVKFAKNKKEVTRYNQDGQFFANMALNAGVLKL
jgi:hypothetical protein